MVSRVALVGASNLVSFERQPWVTCTCLEPCRNRRHCPQVPPQIVYKNFAASGARFQHPDPAKNLFNIFNDALSFRPHTVVVYHDCIMNSLTLPPHAPSNASVLTPNEIINHLQVLQELCRPSQFVVLVRRKKEDSIKLPPDTNRKVGDIARTFESDLDLRMNALLRQNFEYFDLNLSNSSFKINDPAHQTVDSLKMSIGKIVRFYG